MSDAVIDEPTITDAQDAVERAPGHAAGDDGPSVDSGPAKVMRIGSMIRMLLSEVRQAPLDEAGRDLMHDIYQQSVDELSEALSEPLADELRRLTLPFSAELPTEDELRLAQAQLVGWLEGLFHGIQATVAAQREMAEHQLRQMRMPGELEAGVEPSPVERRGAYL